MYVSLQRVTEDVIIKIDASYVRQYILVHKLRIDEDDATLKLYFLLKSVAVLYAWYVLRITLGLLFFFYVQIWLLGNEKLLDGGMSYSINIFIVVAAG